ncbi:ABC transporter [Mycobacterium sp. 1245111.1]|uniref:ABC transporter permease n=1 Tax=Mycobacterium sp. 1245111.1 TaxID=1834073 RepID=UPI0007FF14AF|nr:ABC transporter permease [Mycobacterium sp. 1245111.1]OBK40980.1 ABC transporter [Mycobacterium sp. 1245111.1]
MTAVAALTERMVLGALRDDLPFAVLAPAGNFVVFNFGLRNVIDTGQMSYPQYLLPVIIVQVMLLGALTTVDRAARDQGSDFGIRLRTLPISTAVPLTARMLYCLFRGALALLAAIAVGYVFGFRMLGGVVYAGGFAVLVLTLTVAVSLGADAAGTKIAASGIAGAEMGSSGGASQLLLVPQLLLVMLSTGMAPADAFPDWLHPFVQYQPVSQVTETLRGLAAGHVTIGTLAASVTWCLGLLAVFGALAVRMQRRTQ